MASSKEFKTRDDWRKERELEEARKAGTAAPLKDDEGNDINPHIPQYISQAPWYLKRENPSLKHQRPFHSKVDGAKLGEWYARGVRKATTTTKFRKGACENCGAMTHKTKECCERPRQKGAKFTGEDIQADEVVQEIVLDYDGKRDRWNGWDASMYDDLQRKWDKMDQLRRKKKSEELSSKFMTEPDPSQKRFPHGKDGENTSLADDSDSDKETGEGEDYADANLVLQGRDSKSRMTVRNLRIREDTAKYLRNLALESAHYDPKTRSMRANPTPNADPNEATYSGDNFVRMTGDTLNFSAIQKFAWEAYDKGQDIHVQAAPSQAALMHKQVKEKKEELKKLQQDAVLKKYGGAEHLDALPRELIYAQTENYVEYAPDGRVITGHETKNVVLSKYEEDVYKNNHTSVWGSYWEAGQWGYACCKQMVRNSYCTGEAGRLAKESVEREIMRGLTAGHGDAEGEEEKEEGEKEERVLLPRGEKTKEEKEEDERKRKERLREALEDEEKRKSVMEEQDDRKRRYNAMSRDTYEVTDEQMEAYRQKKLRFDDPMRNFLGSSSKKEGK